MAAVNALTEVLSRRTTFPRLPEFLHQISTRMIRRFFERGDCGFMFEDVAEFVEIFQDAGFRKRVDGECYGWAALDRERLSSEVDGHQGSRFQQRVRFRIDDDREKAILESVLAKDVGEARRDDSLEAKVCQRPDGVLA